MQRWNFCGNEAFLVLLIAPRGPEDLGRTHLCIQPMVSEANGSSMQSFRPFGHGAGGHATRAARPNIGRVSTWVLLLG
jgi:hypothetical protein